MRIKIAGNQTIRIVGKLKNEKMKSLKKARNPNSKRTANIRKSKANEISLFTVL